MHIQREQFREFAKATMVNGGNRILTKKERVKFDPSNLEHLKVVGEILSGKPPSIIFEILPEYVDVRAMVLTEISKHVVQKAVEQPEIKIHPCTCCGDRQPHFVPLCGCNT